MSVDDLELPPVVMNGSNNQSTASLDRNSPSFSESQSGSQNTQVEQSMLQRALTGHSMSSQPSARDDLTSHPGYRAAEAYIRPSAAATHGALTQFGFDLKNCTFTLSLVSDSATPDESPTVIYLPEVHFPSMHTEVSVSGGKWEIERQQLKSGMIQLLKWWHAGGDQDIKVIGAKRKLQGAADATAEDEGYLDQCQQGSCIMM